MYIIRLVLDNDKVFIAILLPVVSDEDKMLKYILADKEQCTNVFIIRWVPHNDKVIIAVQLPVASDRDSMLKYLLAYHSL